MAPEEVWRLTQSGNLPQENTKGPPGREVKGEGQRGAG